MGPVNQLCPPISLSAHILAQADLSSWNRGAPRSRCESTTVRLLEGREGRREEGKERQKLLPMVCWN